MKKLPGVNIQWPISKSILDGSKVIETRTYPLPEKYLGKELLLIETPGKNGKFKARGVAIIIFKSSFKYKNKKEFKKDFKKHLVEPNSIWDWTDKQKFGWTISKVTLLKEHINVPAKRGYVFTSPIPT